MAHLLRRLLPLLLLLPAATAARASSVPPGHPLWRQPGVAVERWERALADLARSRRDQPRPLPRGDEGARKVFRTPAHRFLVLPVLYADGPDSGPVAVEEVRAFFFDPERPGSFTRYWREASQGAFAPTGEVLPWLRLPGDAASYFNFVDGRPRLAGTRALARDAVCAAGGLVDLRGFDDDGPDGIPGSGDDDGIVDFLVILTPYEGLETRPALDGVVALQDRIDADETAADCGLAADPFVVVSALSPVGVAVHEVGHLLGLVDLYDLDLRPSDVEDGRAHGGLGRWSLMATGTWGGEGEQPTGLDPYSLSLLDWGEAVEVGAVDTFTLRADRLERAVLRPARDWGSERFVLAARSPRSGSPVDRALPGEGVLLYRVDERGPWCGAEEERLVSVVAADGRNDLEELVNEGDAGDPWPGSTGATLFGPGTVPSSYPRAPGPEKLPPRLEVQSLGDGAWRLRWHAAAVGELRLSRAWFPDSGGYHLAPGQEAVWEVAFVEVGADPVDAARIRVVETAPGLTASPVASVDLEETSPGIWSSGRGLALRAEASLAWGDAALRLEVVADGRAHVLEMGVPVGPAGVAATAFAGWSATAPRPGIPATSFSPAEALDLPVGAAAGWRLRADGSAPYGACAEVELRSPWLAPAGGGEVLRFLSTFHTEAADPGEAFDGGVVEMRLPGQAWRSLTPQGGPTVLVVPLGGAATAGGVGLGRGPWPWTLYEAFLPERTAPYQLRFRFGSDATVAPSIAEGAWDLADAAVVPAGGAAPRLEILPSDPGRLELRLSAPVERARLWGLAGPPSGRWLPLGPAGDLVEGQILFDLPAPEERTLLLGAFAGEEPRLLLATTGYRGSDPSASVLRPRPNPAVGRVDLTTTPRPEARRILIYDLRGRLVRALHLPPQVGVARWDGRDHRGARVASGSYLARLEGAPGPPAAFVLVH